MMISRSTAIQNNKPRYFGKVCLNHPDLNGERYTASYGCIKCNLEAVKKNQAKDRDLVHSRNKQYREKNPEKIRQMHQDWREKNVVYDAKRKRQYRLNNAQKVSAAYKEYYKTNYTRMLAKRNKQHADKLKRTPAWLTADDLWMIEQAYDLSALRTKLLGFAWHVDHIIPLRGKLVSGFHTPYNLQVIPAVDNLRKSNQIEVANG
jgi:hypothetical protein